MLGAIIGDIVGSRFEWNNHRDKDFELFTNGCFPTDDSIMSLAIARAIIVSKPDFSDLSDNAVKCMQSIGRNYPDCGYGGRFYGWIKGAEATAVAIYMAKTGSGIFEIKDYIKENYYPMNFTLDEIRDTYRFNETCQDTVPQALQAFFESTGFEDAIRNAISIGGDSDTLAAICGSVAEAYYGIPDDIRKQALTFLDKDLLKLLTLFESKYTPIVEKIH